MGSGVSGPLTWPEDKGLPLRRSPPPPVPASPLSRSLLVSRSISLTSCSLLMESPVLESSSPWKVLGPCAMKTTACWLWIPWPAWVEPQSMPTSWRLMSSTPAAKRFSVSHQAQLPSPSAPRQQLHSKQGRILPAPSTWTLAGWESTGTAGQAREGSTTTPHPSTPSRYHRALTGPLSASTAWPTTLLKSLEDLDPQLARSGELESWETMPTSRLSPRFWMLSRRPLQLKESEDR